jgi:hypothetical protein
MDENLCPRPNDNPRQRDADGKHEYFRQSLRIAVYAQKDAVQRR